MENIAWSEDLLLGVDEIDRSHQLFLAQLNQLRLAADSDLPEKLAALTKEMESDFFHEEALMEKLNYPDIKMHREQHAMVLSAFHIIVPEVMQGKFSNARNALELLPQWLVMHIKTVDKALVLFWLQAKKNSCQTAVSMEI